jgi:hypothetical protein
MVWRVIQDAGCRLQDEGLISEVPLHEGVRSGLIIR